MRGVFLEEEFIRSPAFEALWKKSPAAVRVLLEFYRRRQIVKQKNRRGRHCEKQIVNNGNIELPYSYAIKHLRISQATYSRCLDVLVHLGFLDIAEESCGLMRQPTKWYISERWKKYGQADFQEVKRPKRIPPFAKVKKNQLSSMITTRGAITITYEQ